MASLGATNPTFLDVIRRTDPNGAIASIAEYLTKVNPILEDMTAVEGNLPTGHRFTSRTALPSLTWRRFNEGVAPTKSTTQQHDESCGMLEGYSKVDVDLASLNGNAAAFRASEDRAFVQAFNNEIATGIFYHSTQVSPEKFQGLSPRMDSTTGEAGGQIKLAETDDTGTDYASVWLIGWSPDTVFGIYPKGSQGGLSNEDLGKQLVSDGSNDYLAYVTRWQWKFGLCVRDYRYVARLANIDTGSLAATGTDLIYGMADLLSYLQDLNTVRPAFYMNRKVFSFLNQQLMNKQGNLLEWIDMGGRRIPSYLGIPIRVTDALLNTEDGLA